MIKMILVLVIGLLSLSWAFAQNTTDRTHYPDGKPKLWKEMVDGKAHGLWLEWYPDGIIRYRAFWKEGKGHGRWEYYYPNGQLRSEETYLMDIPVGLARYYYGNGQLQSEMTYIDGKRDGMLHTFDVNGQPTESQRYTMGERVLDKPVLFAEGPFASKDFHRWGITFTPDGQTAYTTQRLTSGGEQKIYVTQKREGTWSELAVASFSTARDEGAHLTRDGKRLYFASTRPLPYAKREIEGDMNLWYVDWTGTAWGAPQALPATINQTMKKGEPWPAHYETGPAVDPAGNLYYWTKSSTGPDANIFMVALQPDGSFAAPTELPAPVNQSGYDSGPMISPNGQYLLFAAYDRADGYGAEDLYIAKRQGKGWSEPQNLGIAINSMYNESFPSFSPDGKYFYFSSDREGAKAGEEDPVWRLYYMESRFLFTEE